MAPDPGPPAQPSATVVIVTRNRSGELCRAVRSTLVQQPEPEVIVFDDASTDDTPEVVRKDFPSVRLERADDPVGYIVHRNAAARIARADHVVSVDDDAEFLATDVVARAIAAFDHPRVGAVALPYRQFADGGRLEQQPPTEAEAWAASTFTGTAYAIRRDAFLEVGGFCEEFFHEGEEPDLTIRLLDAGFLVRLAAAEPINHYASPSRDPSRKLFYGRRNTVLFAWRNVPARHLVPQLARTTLYSLLLGMRRRRLRLVLRGLWCGYRDLFRLRPKREPVDPRVFRLFRRMRRKGPLPFGDAVLALDAIDAAPRRSRGVSRRQRGTA